jgi:hypothetical protein
LLPLANTIIYIGTDNGKKDTSDYFNSVLTDKNGNYSIYVTEVSVKYTVFTVPVIGSSASFAPVYYASATTDLPFVKDKTYPLTAVADGDLGNGISFVAQDVNLKNIPGVKVIVYTW